MNLEDIICVLSNFNIFCIYEIIIQISAKAII